MSSPDVPDLARHGIFTTADALGAGFTRGAIRHRLAIGSWRQVRRGFYVDAIDTVARASGDQRHIELAAALGAMASGAVASHWSAARLLGVDTLVSSDRIWLTRPPTSGHGTHALPGVIERAATLSSAHITVVDGLPTTTAARTVADLARHGTVAVGVVSADSALRAGHATADELLAVARDCRAWPGGSRAITAARLADARAESPLETISRLGFRGFQLPETPELQVPLYDEAGLIGRVDFLWRKHRIVGEADGRAKYDRPQVLWNEKRREDRLRAAGFEVVRWSWDDITHRPELVSERLLTAFARASARTSQL